jgi:TetR/AcrR family transcriptional regulator, cholesterol catabolism regulator
MIRGMAIADASDRVGRTAASKRLMADIQRTAASMIREEGFGGASMQTLADKLGLLKPTLYYHVQSKENLLFRLIVDVTDERVRRWSKVLAQPASATARLALLVEEHFHMVARYQDELIVLSDEITHLSRAHLDHVAGRIAVGRDLVRELVEEGCGSGEFDVRDPAAAATVVFGILNSTIRWYRPGGRMKPVELARETTSLILDGVCAPE